MQLKLVMGNWSKEFSTIQSGSVEKWYKTEGEEIRYGDDLFDFEVEQTTSSSATYEQMSRVRPYLRYFVETLAQTKGSADLTRPSAIEKVEIEEIPSNAPAMIVNASGSVRIRSSDQGILRKIYAREGEHRESGDILALLTTALDDPIEDTGQGWKDASVFRVLPVVDFERGDKAAEPKRAERRYTGPGYVMFWSELEAGNRVGIYVTRGFPLLPIFGTVPLIHRTFRGRCCILQQSWLDLRSDLLLEYLHGYASQQIDELSDRLNLSAWWLQPQWLDKNFGVAGPDGDEEFPKTVIVLSIAADLEESCFRHKDSGILVPSKAMYKLDAEGLEWFRRDFIPLGRLSGEDFLKSFGKLIQVLQRQTGAHVLVSNAFTSAPRSSDHSYRFLEDHPGVRRLEFNLALAELSRQLDFSILDVDRILKKSGTEDQLDWDSAAPNMYPVIAREAYRILRVRGLVC